MAGLQLPTALDALLMKTIEVNGEAVPIRSILNFIGSVTWDDNPTNDSTDVNLTPPASAWQTGFDFSFDQEPNQSFSTDGNSTFAGLTWTKYRSVVDASPLANVNGSGLVVQPGSAGSLSAGAIPYPRLGIAFSQILPSGFDVDWPLRIRARVTSLTSGSDVQAALFASCTPDGGGGFQIYYALTKGATDQYAAIASQHTQSSGLTYTDSSAYSTYDTLGLYLPGGLAGGVLAGFACSNVAAPLFWIGTTQVTTGQPAGSTAGLAANWSVLLGATRSTTTTSVTFQRLQVQYLAR